MGFPSLAEWLAWQEQLHPSEIELGLERTRSVATRLAFFLAPKPTTVIVGGTNGKGSCVAYLESILTAEGYRVGAYSSPHLLRYNERVRVNGIPVEDRAFCESFERINEVRGDIPLTYFEFGTLAALDIFFQQGVEVQILEVGLGGRLDAVNIVEPDAAVVVNVALDHQAWLGDTRELIGIEKAGIFRANIPLIIGETEPPASVLAAAAALGNQRLGISGRHFGIAQHADGWDFTGVQGRDRNPVHWPHLPRGRLPLPSAACALQVLAELGLATLPAIRKGLETADLPGRCQQLLWKQRRVVLDVAHNPAGAGYLASWLREQGRENLRIIFSALADKDYRASMAALKPLSCDWYLAPLPVSRAAPLEKLCQSAADLGVPAQGFDTIAAALESAVEASRPGDSLLVSGSFYTVAEVLRHLESTDLVGSMGSIGENQ